MNMHVMRGLSCKLEEAVLLVKSAVSGASRVCLSPKSPCLFLPEFSIIKLSPNFNIIPLIYG